MCIRDRVEAVAGDPAGGVQIDAVEGLHDLRVIGDGELGDLGLTEALHFHVAGVVGTNGHGGIDDLGNLEHVLVEGGFQFRFHLFQLGQAVGLLLHLGLHGLSLLELAGVLLGLAHQHTDLLGEGVAVGAQPVSYTHLRGAPVFAAVLLVV